ncbi:site-specific integrase [Dyella sp. ASV21]|uniref:site-specific integrase n=1 Tax=Dyella sp. ASV21 TaxID=2795114 RepID=UPI0018EA3CB6|nr:site-specific integrase [Dyella sp. ASV21]
MSPSRAGRPLRPIPSLPHARAPSSEAAALADQIIQSIGAAPPPAERHRFYATTEDGQRVIVRSNQSVEVALAQLEGKANALITEVRQGKAGTPMRVGGTERKARERPSERHQRSLFPHGTPSLEASDHPVVEGPRHRNGLYIPGLPPQGHHLMQQLRQHHDHLVSWHSSHPVITTQAEPLRLSDRLPTFLGLLQQRRCSRSVLVDSLWTYRIFMELVGDKQLQEINVTDGDMFIHALSMWPAHASKRREFRNMRAPEIIAKAQRLHRPPLNLRTQQKHIERLRALFHWLERRGEITPGLLRGVRLYQRHQDFGRPRAPFSDEQLQRMFGVHQNIAHKTPYQYWAPILGLYQGMRVNEIGQLYVDDVVQMSGMWCIDVTRDRPGQRLKNRMSRRLLPIHPKILECGFIDFAEQARHWKRTTLFPDVVWGTNGPGDCISDWFNRIFLRRSCGIVHPSLTFHSFRHCFATLGDRSNVRHDRLALLLGHSAGQSVLREHYIKNCGPKDLDADLKAIQFPLIEHAPYEPSRFDHAFEKAARLSQQLSKLDAVYGPRKA